MYIYIYIYLFIYSRNPTIYIYIHKSKRQIKKTQDELQWIVAQRLLSALTIPGFN